MKRIIHIAILTFCVGVCWVAWELWMMQGRLSVVHWITTDGSLEIDHMPGKNHTFLRIHDGYVPHLKRIWLKDIPGATKRWIGRVPVPSPDELFQRADILWQYSDSEALCRFYAEASEKQKVNIRSYLRELQERREVQGDLRECLESIEQQN